MSDTTLRDAIKTATVTAMKAKDKDRTAALRLIGAKIKDRDIEMRTSSKEVEDDAMVIDVLQKMGKQRRESIQMYTDGGRTELAAKEEAELAVIEEFLPQQMGEDETRAAIDAIKAELNAEGMKDMGRVMGELKARHGAELDMSKASGLVKAALS
ncbi:GatB/YqeY domain-containing protein [Parerythrobacter jejuensis]|uniref:GatB/YqeY domain-containing protein n=1 Tax=Parerythrobacter jejuensis TaxID=795812 RepID=A0A845ATY1_9SPHN|nr:GatB/YqeY domain-containing protein [Parerythrobacter jejuensis]MXP32281.1 GatB/YqeY domain-containing protein [Parerythrobacter jejuensis]